MPWIKQLFGRQQIYNELSDEIAQHLEMKKAEFVAAGMSEQDADTAARREFGNVARLEESGRQVWEWAWLERLLANARFGLRQLRKAPAFAAVAIGTLAVGIGAVTSIFSIVETILLRPLPFPQSGQLVCLNEDFEHAFSGLELTAPHVIAIARENRAFTGVAGYTSSNYELTGAGAPFLARGERVSASLFPVLGVMPLLGRAFTPEEDEKSIPVAVISYGLWQSRFQGDPSALGRTIDLDRKPYTIIGVMSRDFEFPLEPGHLSHRDLWVPMSFTDEEKKADLDDWNYSGVARIREDSNWPQAQGDLDRIIHGVESQYPPQFNVHLHLRMKSLKERTVSEARPILRVLLLVVLMILLIACANLANLLLVRTNARRREFGVRLAIGAARSSLLRQLLTESFVLCVLGGAAGVGLAIALVQLGKWYLPESLPRISEISVHWPVLLFCTALICATSVLCGLGPALAARQTNVFSALRDGGLGAGTGSANHRFRGVLVALETGLALLLLVGSGLFLRSFERMLSTDPGFRPERLVTALVSLPQNAYSSQQRVDEFYDRLRERLAALPQVTNVGFSSNIPVVGQNSSRLFTPEGGLQNASPELPISSNYLVRADYFRALGIPLRAGRYFEDKDDQPGAPLVAIVSESTAHRFWPGQDAVGRRLKTGSTESQLPWMTVVGVVGDVKQASLDKDTALETYQPSTQLGPDLGPVFARIGPVRSMRISVRTAGEPAALMTMLPTTIHNLDLQLAVTQIRSMEDIVSLTEAPRRFNTVVVTTFAAIALLLALLGIYGILAYTVSERTREIAVRMALGAPRSSVLGSVLKTALGFAGAGALAGLAVCFEVTRLLRTLLYGIHPLDAISYAAAITVLLACALLASSIPARRAISIDPMRALREE